MSIAFYPPVSGGSGAWGSITGTLSNQTDLQTALNLKAPKASPAFTGTIGTALTVSRALVTDGSGNLAVSAVTSTVLGYLDVGSSLTTLLAAKAPLASPTFTGTIGTPLTASRTLVTDSSGNLAVSAVTSTVLGYLDVGSSLTTLLAAKAPLAAPTFTTSTTHSYATASTVAVFDGSKNLTSSSITSTQLSTILIDDVSGFLEAPTDKIFTLVEYASFAFTINTLVTKLVSGTCSIAIKINGTNVTGISAHSATSSQVTSTASAANAVAAGDRVTLVVSSSSTPVDLAFSLKRTGA